LYGVADFVVGFISPAFGDVGVEASSAADAKDFALTAGFFLNKHLG